MSTNTDFILGFLSARIASKAPYENFKARLLQKSSYGLSHSVAEKVAGNHFLPVFISRKY